MTPTSAERGHETRAKLLEAAARLIVEEGWGGVTTRKVADRAGLRAGLVHYHFASVTDLLIDAALDQVRREVDAAAATLEKAADPAAGVDRILERMAAYSPNDPVTILFSEMLLASTRHKRLRGELSALLTAWRSQVAGWLRESGCAPDDSDATALVLGAAIDGLVLHRLVDPALAEVPVTGVLRRLIGVRGAADGPVEGAAQGGPRSTGPHIPQSGGPQGDAPQSIPQDGAGNGAVR